jgi:multicomponent Na+:H+ antiporter subunit D
VPDIDYLYNRGFFYGGRAVIVATTGLYAAVDSVAVGFVRRCYWIGANPVLAVESGTRWLPDAFRPAAARISANGGRPSKLYLRAGIGTTILVFGAVLTVLLLVSL